MNHAEDNCVMDPEDAWRLLASPLYPQRPISIQNPALGKIIVNSEYKKMATRERYQYQKQKLDRDKTNNRPSSGGSDGVHGNDGNDADDGRGQKKSGGRPPAYTPHLNRADIEFLMGVLGLPLPGDTEAITGTHGWRVHYATKESRVDDRTRQCAVLMCDHEGTSERLLPICQNHFLHVGCMRSLLRASPLPKCPLCKDPFMAEFRKIIQDEQYEYDESDQTDFEPHPSDFLDPQDGEEVMHMDFVAADGGTNPLNLMFIASMLGLGVTAPSDAPSDAPDDTLDDTPSDAPSDASSDAPDDTPSDASSDAPSDAPDDTPSDAPGGAAMGGGMLGRPPSMANLILMNAYSSFAQAQAQAQAHETAPRAVQFTLGSGDTIDIETLFARSVNEMAMREEAVHAAQNALLGQLLSRLARAGHEQSQAGNGQSQAEGSAAPIVRSRSSSRDIYDDYAETDMDLETTNSSDEDN